MKNKITSNIAIIISAIILIGLVCFGVYKLTGTSTFDTTGGYIKDMASDKDVITFMEIAKTPSYKELLDGNVKELSENPYKYYGTITEKTVNRDRTAEYEMEVLLNKKDSNALGNTYRKTREGLCIVPVAFKTEEQYNTFAIGDEIYMYGTLDDFVEIGDYEKVPHFEAKKLVLDIEIE